MVKLKLLTEADISTTDIANIKNTSGINTGDNATNTQYLGLITSKADVGQTFYIGTTQVAINRASGALTLAGLTFTTPNIGSASANSIAGTSATQLRFDAKAIVGATGNGASSIMTGGYGGSTSGNGGAVKLYAGWGGDTTGNGGDIVLCPGNGAAANGKVVFYDDNTSLSAYFDVIGKLSANRTYTLPDATGTILLDTTAPNSSYTLMGNTSIATPADATTYYFGSPGYAGGTSAGFYRFRIPKAGTIKYVIIDSYYSGTQPSNETSTVNLKVNGGSNVVVLDGTLKNDGNGASFSNYALSTAVAQGDYVEFNWVTPTWATNPGTSIMLKTTLYIE